MKTHSIALTKHLKNHPLLILSGIVLITAGIISNPSFATLINLQNLLRYVAIVGTISVGITVVFLIKEIDVSIGSLLAFNIILATYITAEFYSWAGIEIIGPSKYIMGGIGSVIFLTIVVGTLIGLLNGLITTKAKISSLITTLGVLYAARGLSYIMTNGQSLHFQRFTQFKWLGSHTLLGIPANFVLFFLLGAATAFCLRFTVIGGRIYSIGGNAHAARLSGINVNLWIILALGFSGFCSGVASFMYSSYMASADPGQGVGYEFSAIATAVLGGTTLEGGKGSIYGTMAAACVIGLLNNVLELAGVKIFYQNLILGCIIIVAVAPTYFGKKAI